MIDNNIELIIADDSNITIDCLKNWIKGDQTIKLVGVVQCENELISAIENYNSAIVVGSFPWIIKQGKLRITQLLDRYPEIKYALFLNSNYYSIIHELADIGIKGFFGDVTTQDDLIKGLCVLKKYNYFMAPEIFAEFIGEKKKSNGNGNTDRFNLTNRESEILRFVLGGKSSKDIARLLNISKRTVDGHRANLNTKFGVRNAAQLYKKAANFAFIL